MKRIFFLAALIVALAGISITASPAPKGRYHIKGILKNIPDGTVVCLFRQEGRVLNCFAKDTLQSGAFSFSDTISAPIKLNISCFGKGFPSSMLAVWVAPSKRTTVTGCDKLVNLWTVKSNVAEQKEENRFQQLLFDIRTELAKLDVQESELKNKLFNEEGEMQASGDELHRAFDSINKIRKLEEPLNNKITCGELEYMKSAPLSAVWMNRLLGYVSQLSSSELKSYIETIHSLYHRIPERMRLTRVGKDITALLFPQKTVKVGDMMVDGLLYDKDGNQHHLSEFKGRHIFLDFWSSACAPCLASLPELERVTERYKDKLAVVSISEDPKDLWISFLQEKNMKGNQWNELRSSRTGLSAIYNVTGIPHYVLIDADGKILDISCGYDEGRIEELLKKYLK